MTKQSPASMVQRLELLAEETDAERPGRIKRALREADRSAALVISGSFDGTVTDAKAHADAIHLLIDAPLPILALVSGPVGPRGIGLLLAADHAVLGPQSRMGGNWRAAPGAMALFAHRCGPLLARRMAFGPSVDPLILLAESGLATHASDPALVVDEIAGGLVEDRLGHRLKRSLRSASEMPLKEAFTFDLWFSHTPDRSTT